MSENDKEPEDPQVEHDKVQEEIDKVLRGDGPKGPTVPLDLDPGVAERLATRDAINKGEDPTPTEEVEPTPEDPDRGRESKLFKANQPEESGIKAWALQMPELSRADIEPTHLDKMAYMKAMLHDTELKLNINLPAVKLKIVMRSLNNFEQDVVFKALEADQQDKEIAGPAAYVTRMQYYAAIMQIVSFNKKRQDYVSFPSDKEFPSTEDAAKELRTKTKKYISANNWATWQTKLTALRIFEEKMTLCNRSVLDENFWMPADTD